MGPWQGKEREVPESSYRLTCMHCGSVGAQRIGYCDHCGMAVCEKCGNTQMTHGALKVFHDSCLRDSSEDSFSMIKFRK